MKSRKFKAVLAAVSAIAVLATAMTGFAATLNTTTTYNFANNKVAVKTVVGEVNDGTQVTYLVKTVEGAGVQNQGIAYIDQKAASDGATFEWQIDRDVLSNALEADVIVGNDEGDATATGDLGVKAIAPVSKTGYTVTYGDVEYAGTETIDAYVTAEEGYVVKSVLIDGVPQSNVATSYEVTVTNGDPQTVTAEVEKKVTTPEVVTNTIQRPVTEPTDGDFVGKAMNATIFKINGFDAENYVAGVEYNGEKYPAVYGLTNNGGYIIVELVTEKGVTVTATPYCDPQK